MRILDAFELVAIGAMIKRESKVEDSTRQEVMNLCMLYYDSPQLVYLLDYIDCNASNNNTLMSSSTWTTSLHEECVRNGYSPEKVEVGSYTNMVDCNNRLSFLPGSQKNGIKAVIETVQTKLFRLPVRALFIGAIIISIPYIVA
jgi:hypothetical protein